MFTFKSFSQSAIIDQSDLVIEGEVISVASKWKDDRTRIITESLVKVKSIFKGELRDSIIKIESFGGEVEEDFHFSPHNISLQKGYKGYFFLTSNFDFIDHFSGFAYLENGLNRKVRYEGVLYEEANFEKQIISSTKYPKLSTKVYFELSKNNSLNQNDSCNINTFLKTKNKIDFTFKNVRYTGNFQYLEFDISAKVNTPGLKFGKGNLYIKYSEHFGSNVITNNTVQVTRGTIIQNQNYSLTSFDFAAQTLKISIEPQIASNELYTFSEEETDLVHLKVKISDITSIGSISFDNIDISGEIFYWCQGSYNLFDETNLSKPITYTDGSPDKSIGITYTFENGIYNSSTNKFSVEVFAVATSPSKYSDAFIYINYNELGFGSNVIQSNTAQFQQQDLIGNNIVYNVFKSDLDQNTIQLVVYSNTPNSLETLGTTPRKLGTLTFSVINCDETKKISYDPKTEVSDHIHYTGNMPIPYELYIPIIADDEENGSICGCKKPVITSFSPTTIHGGIGEILTINGINFGTFDPAKSNVKFKNGDDSGPSEVEAGLSDFRWNNLLHWTDTEIKLKVPGCDKNIGTGGPPATGKFTVTNACETSEESNPKLDIPFSILNYRAVLNGVARRLNLQSNNPDNSICFQFSNQLPDWIKSQFIIALSEWCPATGINFRIGATNNSNTPQGAIDGVNLVSIESGSGGFMRTNSFYFQNCANDEKYFSEVDFVLKTDLTNPTPQDEENMREIIKHELGHAHMLQHAKGFGQLMHPNGNSGGIITSNDQTGANLVFGASAACGGNPIGSGTCRTSCSANSTSDILSDNIIILNNLTCNLINISSNKGLIEYVSIVNLQGQILNNTIVNKAKVEINISNLPSGIYSCVILVKDRLISKLFLKI